MKKFGAIRLFFLLILVLILSVVPTIGRYFAKSDITKQRLFGSESENCILVVWNIDTFEGGNTSKSDVLETISKQFEQQNKGAFVLVKNLSIEEFLNRIESEKPDVISFGYGLFNNVSNSLIALDYSNDLFCNVLQSALVNEQLFAYPWCLGAYFVLATEESISSTMANYNDMIKNCFNYSKDGTFGKKTKHIYSLELGTNAFCSAKNALVKQVEWNESGLDSDWEKQSFYDAYVKFMNGKSTFLLGTQRDVSRLENKKAQGAIQGLYGEVLSSTDLIQYIGVVCTGDETKQSLSEKFCKFLLGGYVQNHLLGFGLLPTCAGCEKKCESDLLISAYDKLTEFEIAAIE